MATLQDIAQEAQVSPTAVSMVINGRRGISCGTRQRVEAVMRRLNYRPRAAGRPPKDIPVRNIGIVYAQRVVLSGSLTPLASAWINGMRREAGNFSSHVNVFAGTGHCDQDTIFRHALEHKELDGVILIGMGDENGYVSAAKKQGIPIVVMNRRPAHDEFSYVGIDNYGGSRAAAQHLMALGHRRLALVPHGETTQPIVAEKILGFEEALAEQNLKPVCWQPVNPLDFEPAVEAICRRIVSSGATGVFVMGDSIAVACLDRWAAMDIAVPRQLSVVGFDDLGMSSARGLRPTSIGYDKEMMGREAVRILLRLAEEQPGTTSIALVAGTQVMSYDTTNSAAGDGEMVSPRTGAVPGTL